MINKFEKGNLISKVDLKEVDFKNLKLSKSGKSYIVCAERGEVNIDGMSMKVSVMAYISKDEYEDRFLDATQETPASSNIKLDADARIDRLEAMMSQLLQKLG